MPVNPELLKMARQNIKQAFVAAGDPAMGADPAMAGGAPPMDPAMAGMDPAMAGGAPPMDPAMAGGMPDPSMAGGAMGGDPLAALQPMIDQAVQTAVAAQGGGSGSGGGGGGAKAPKIDVGRELKDLKQQMSKMMDVMGITMTPSEVYGEEEQEPQDPMAGAAPEVAPEAAGGAFGAINPIAPMKAAEWEQGEAIAPPDYINDQVESDFKSISNMAAAMLTMKHAK